MACNEPTSGFVRSDDILRTDRFTDFSTVPSRGYSLLVRAKRHGRWWMLKGLKEPYRNDTVYQVLLQKEYEITSQLQYPMVVSVFSVEEVEGFGAMYRDGVDRRPDSERMAGTGKALAKTALSCGRHAYGSLGLCP